MARITGSYLSMTKWRIAYPECEQKSVSNEIHILSCHSYQISQMLSAKGDQKCSRELCGVRGDNIGDVSLLTRRHLLYFQSLPSRGM